MYMRYEHDDWKIKPQQYLSEIKLKVEGDSDLTRRTGDLAMRMRVYDDNNRGLYWVLMRFIKFVHDNIINPIICVRCDRSKAARRCTACDHRLRE